MLRLISLLDWVAEQVIPIIDLSGIFCTTVLETLKKNIGDKLLVAHLNIKVVFDCPQLIANNRIRLCNFHQHLKSATLGCIQLATRYPYFHATKTSNFMEGSINWIVLDR